MPDEAKETNETVEVSEVTEAEPTAFATDGLLPEEIKMAEGHGLVEETKEVKETSKEEKDGEHEEQPKPETSEDTGTEEEEEEVKPTFDEVEKNEDGLKKYNPNEQALYWKYKSDKKKRQKAQKDLEEYKAEYELGTIKETSRVGKISEALNKEGVTIEELQAIIGGDTEDSAPLTKAEYKKIESAKASKAKETEEDNQIRAERLTTAEGIGKTKYKDFDELTTLAQEVVDSDKSGTYKSVLNAAFSDKEIDEEQLVERVVTIAKLNPNYGKKKSEDSKEEPTGKKETDADRAIKNSKKKVSSASVGSGGGQRNISHDDLTVDDAARLTATQWRKLPENVRKRLLMK